MYRKKHASENTGKGTMLILVLVTAVACLGFVVFVPGNNPGSGPSEPNPGQLANICGTDKAPRAQLSSSADSHLKKLAEYEAVCEGAFADRFMLFSSTPRTTEEAAPLAAGMAETLKEFAKYRVAPLVVLEPTAMDGTILPLGNFRKGLYDAGFGTYFQALKDAGITDEMMGMWVLFPEANTPAWNTTDPAVFADNVTHVAGLQKQYFPKSKVSILLDSRSYPNDDPAWAKGEYKSLRPYVADIPEGTVDSFGYQGFPWLPPADSPDDSKTTVDAAKYLRASIASEAAEVLGIKDVWFNTGTFGKAHAASPDTIVHVEPADREDMLDGVMSQVRELRHEGLEVAVHLFSEDKSKTKEGMDWSYWSQGHPKTGEATKLFQDFVRKAGLGNVPIWLYDDYQSPPTSQP
jgi:hypothetical protein